MPRKEEPSCSSPFSAPSKEAVELCEVGSDRSGLQANNSAISFHVSVTVALSLRNKPLFMEKLTEVTVAASE